MLYFIFLTLFVSLFVTGCEKEKIKGKEVQPTSTQHLVIQKESLKVSLKESACKKIEEMKKELPKSATIEVSPILQNPELPTGCESVALTMALESLGYELEKTQIADEYLIYGQENYAAGYVGDPYSYAGVGIYPPGLAQSANRFLEQHYQQQTAYDISKLRFEELFPYVAAGFPVLIWLTIDYEKPYISSASATYNGEEYIWYWNEHCVILGGYDLEDQTVVLYDPLQGRVIQNIETVQSIFEEAGRMAVAIY